jgi:GTP-binding protein Era
MADPLVPAGPTTPATAEGSLINAPEVFSRWSLAASEVAESLSQSLVIAFLGSASSGKDSAIRALFGVDMGRISPIPGSTEDIQVAALDAEGRVLVVNAPGFGDVRVEVDELARRVLDQLDLAVYVVNCDGGASIDERRDLDAIRALGRPTLVCLNKIDLIRPHQREEFVRTTLVQLGVSEEDAVVCAFDPFPAISPEPIGIEPVIGWIHAQLDDGGKGLLFAKHLRNRALACEAIIQSAARRAAMAGALPVPGADITAVTAVQVKLIADIAAVHGEKIGKDLTLFIIGEALAGGSKGFIRWGVEALKAAGWIPGGQLAAIATSALGASVAGATTYGVGHAAVAYLQKGKLSGEDIRAVFDAEAFTYARKGGVTDVPG